MATIAGFVQSLLLPNAFPSTANTQYVQAATTAYPGSVAGAYPQQNVYGAPPPRQQNSISNTNAYSYAPTQAGIQSSLSLAGVQNSGPTPNTTIQQTSAIQQGNLGSLVMSDQTSLGSLNAQSLSAGLTNNPVQSSLTRDNSKQSSTVDKRIRIRAQNNLVYGAGQGGAGILSPLLPGTGSNGLVFMYTPTITMAASAEYAQLSPSQSIQDFYSYSRTPSVQFNISGTFTAQNLSEATYCLAVIHFCRSLTKSDFGESAVNPGLPPPIVLLSGYGTYMFNDLPCIFKGYNMTYDGTVDQVQVTVNGGDAWIPTMFTLSVELIVQNTPDRVLTQFSLQDFRNGNLLLSRGWI